MSPEQVHGSVSRLSDVFSMGVVLWELLTGDRLFQGKSDGEILAAVLLAKAPSARARVPEIPEALDAVVLRSLRRRPEDRFASALEFARALEASTTIASPAEIVAWLQREAGDVLAKREQLFLPRATPFEQPRAPSSAPSRAVIAAIAGGIVAVVGVAVAFASRAPAAEPSRVVAAAAASAPPLEPPPAPTSPASEAPPSDVDRADSASAVASGSREPRSKPARTSRHCDPPYVIDAKDHKIWKRECF